MSASHQPDPQRLSTNAPRSRYQQVPAPAAPHTHAPGERRTDIYYGHEVLATLGARFINHLFECPDHIHPTTQKASSLAVFIAYGLHRTKLPKCVTFASLILLQRLKARFPTARGSSGHRLWISAFMIASKVICDDTYSNKSWGIVAQGMFNLREINQMEREMCNYLEWELSVDNAILDNFEKRLREDYASPSGPYPTYPLSMVSKRAAKAAAANATASTTTTPIPEPSTTTSAIPNFGNQEQPPPSSAPSAPSTYTAGSPQTPSPSYSTSTSPASSASPATPVGGEDYGARVHGLDTDPIFSIIRTLPPVHPLKSQMSALAVPSRW
ncbi:hypothetical protein H0H92_010220 [Tricholoma furcatifolium]|nr:hypothetical protein H0H92_010220 [Tricholoma furcatifolium]